MAHCLKYLAILCVLHSNLFAQESLIWPKPGAKWTYLSFDCKEFAYTRDTVVANHTYKVVDLVAANNTALALDSSYNGYQVRDFSTFFRTSGDTIFRWVDGNEYIFMIQNLGIGGTFDSFRSVGDDWNSYACLEMLPLEVNNIQNVTYNGNVYREVGLEAADWTESLGYFPYHSESTFIFIENIGLKANFVYFVDGYVEGVSNNLDDCAQTVVEGLFVGYLYHYQDEELNLPFFNSSCALNVTEGSPGTNDLTIYPNPNYGTVNYRIDQNTVGGFTFEVFDLSGKQLYKSLNNHAEGRLDLRPLSSGMCIIKASNANAVYTRKLIVQ